MEIVQGALPYSRTMQHYHLDLAASVRAVIHSCETIRDLSEVAINSTPAHFDEIYIVCYTFLEFSIKNNGTMSRGQSEGYVLVSPDIKIPHEHKK